MPSERTHKIRTLLRELDIESATIVMRVTPNPETPGRDADIGPVNKLDEESEEWYVANTKTIPQSNRTHKVVSRKVGPHIVFAYVPR